MTQKKMIVPAGERTGLGVLRGVGQHTEDKVGKEALFLGQLELLKSQVDRTQI